MSKKGLLCKKEGCGMIVIEHPDTEDKNRGCPMDLFYCPECNTLYFRDGNPVTHPIKGQMFYINNQIVGIDGKRLLDN